MSQVTNDFTIQVGTVNGSGSQSSNMILMRSIFNMGIPVTGKNLFPSNIAGLPTWFTIRVCKNGYQAGRRRCDLYVGMNPATVQKDVDRLPEGSTVIYNSSLALDRKREDLHFFPCPFDELVKEACPVAKLRRLVINMIYVGAVAELLGIDQAAIDQAVSKQFASKPRAVDLNVGAIRAGREFVRKAFPATGDFPLRVEPMDRTRGMILVEGNMAAAIGAVFGGCTVLAWYPITPSSSLCENFISLAEKYRIDPETKKKNFAVVQAEDEIASIGMVLGAGWAGARSMTSTSGPGVSLMSEFVGLGYYAEVPGVIFDVQRVGPSTGLPTRTAQGDIIATAFLSHGDTRHLVLLPSSVHECYEFAMAAFDLAERFLTPVFVLTDLDLGMNSWMSKPFDYPEKPFDRGKVLDAEALSRIGRFERYRDVDGDGVPYRTLPGTRHPLASYFTRGSGHDEAAAYTEDNETYARVLDRIARKIQTATDHVPQPVETNGGTTRFGILAYGTTHWAIEESLDHLADRGLKTDYLRLRALPVNQVTRSFVERHEKTYVVEQNQQGQLTNILRAELPDLANRLVPVLFYDGLPVDADDVTRRVIEQEGGTYHV